MKNSYDSILAVGCSFVVGANITDPLIPTLEVQKKYRASSLVAKHLNVPEYNIARPGGSNESIIRKTYEWIENNPNKKPLILLGLSGLTRMDIWSEHDKMFYDLHPFDFRDKTPGTSDIAKKRAKKLLGDENLGNEIYTYARTYTENFFNADIEVEKLQRTVIFLDAYIKSKNLNYLIWNSIEDNLGDIKKDLSFLSFNVKEKVDEVESERYFREYSNKPEDCWYQYLRQEHSKMYQDYNDSSKRSNKPPYGEYFCGSHPSPNANKHLANLIINKL